MDNNVKSIMMTLADCTDPKREAEFSKWYSTIHIPDILAGAGSVTACTRFERISGDTGQKYLAVYECNTDDVAKIKGDISAALKVPREKGRMIDCIGNVSSVHYRRVSPTIART